MVRRCSRFVFVLVAILAICAIYVRHRFGYQPHGCIGYVSATLAYVRTYVRTSRTVLAHSCTVLAHSCTVLAHRRHMRSPRAIVSPRASIVQTMDFFQSIFLLACFVELYFGLLFA